MPSKPDANQVLAEIEKLEKFIDDSEFLPASRFYRSNVLLALISKALTVGRAVCALVREGFAGEAFGLSRTLIDIFLNVRYISNKDTEARAGRYVGYFAKTHEGWTKIIRKHYPEKRDMPMPNFHERAMEVAQEYKSPHNWTGLGGQAKEMALEDDTYETDESGHPVKQEFDYEVIYWWTSQFVHGTILSLAGHEMEPGGMFRIRGRMEAESGRGSDALFNVLMYLSKIFICAFRGMKADQPEELLTEIRELVTSFTL
jgi:hypothetical protein